MPSLAPQVLVSPAWWVTRPLCTLFIETQGSGDLGSRAYQQLPWQQPLGPAQPTELSPVSRVCKEGLNTSHIKIFSRVWNVFLQHFTGLVHHMVQAPCLGVWWKGTWLLSSMAASWVPLPPKVEGNGQEPLPRSVGVGAATQESSTDITQPG